MEPAVTARALVERLRDEQVRRRQRAADVRARLPEAVRVLAKDFRARRVVLFGSLLEGELGEESDVDLLVEGLPPGMHLDAASRVWDVLGVPVDIVPRESGRPEIVARALRDGEVLHEP